MNSILNSPQIRHEWDKKSPSLILRWVNHRDMVVDAVVDAVNLGK